MQFKILVWPCITLATFLLAIIVNLSAYFAKNASDLFGSKFTLIDTNHKYRIEVSLPVEYSIFAWLTIYLWNLSWQIYILYILVHKFNYMKSTLFGDFFYQIFCVSNAFNIAYISLLINEYFFTAGIMLLFLTLFLFISNYLAHKFLMFNVPMALYTDPNDRSNSMELIVQKVPFWLKYHSNLRKMFYWLLLNAIPFYCTYTTIELCILCGSFFKYHPNSPVQHLSDETASYITMSLLACGLLTYWIFDFAKFSKNYFINTYSPYLVVITTLTAQIVHIQRFDSRIDAELVFALVLLIVTVLLSALKVFNGCKAYRDAEYVPRYTMTAQRSYNREQTESMDEAERVTQLSTLSADILQQSKVGGGGYRSVDAREQGKEEQTLSNKETGLLRDDNFV